MKSNLINIIDKINELDNFVITSHIAPDGDNIGSIVALGKFLENMNKNTTVILDDAIPQNLLFLTKYKNIVKSDSFDCNTKYNIISLDCAEKGRLSIELEIFEKAELRINIDHHISNTAFGDINYILPDASSTCEVLFEILKQIDESKIDKKIATSLYTGISTDTGNFLFSSVDKDTFLAAAYLTEKGADRELVADEIYRSVDLNQRRLTQYALETLEVYENISTMLISIEMLEKSGVNYEDAELVTNIPINTKGVSVGIAIKEKEKGFYKISFRSKGNIDVCKLAAKFGGGGHKNAAGCSIEGTYLEVKEKLLTETIEYLKKES